MAPSRGSRPAARWAPRPREGAAVGDHAGSLDSRDGQCQRAAGHAVGGPPSGGSDDSSAGTAPPLPCEGMRRLLLALVLCAAMVGVGAAPASAASLVHADGGFTVAITAPPDLQPLPGGRCLATI